MKTKNIKTISGSKRLNTPDFTLYKFAFERHATKETEKDEIYEWKKDEMKYK